MMDCSRLFFFLSLSPFFSSPTYLLEKREESHDREKEKSHRPMMDPHNNNGRRRRRERERERRRRVKLRFFLGNKIRVLFNFKTVVQSDLSGFVCNRTGTNFEVFWLHDLLTSQCFFFFCFPPSFWFALFSYKSVSFCLPLPSSISFVWLLLSSEYELQRCCQL